MPVDKFDLKAEAVLDPTIQFQKPLSENSTNPKSIFLTGATGFLGAYLLDEILHKTSADIYCLVRRREPDTDKQRLKNHLQFHSLWKETFSSRIIPVAGEMSKPLLGLSKQKFSELAEQIDVIYHSGAFVNFTRPYLTLKATNVLGTQEILRLASLTQTKPIHFISSIAVLLGSSQNRKIMETEVLDPGNLKGGYNQSKWIAEKLIITAQERGLPSCIYRSPGIMGHSKTGIIGNLNDPWCNLMKGCVQMSKFPALEMTVNFVPVDYVSQAIVHLSLQEKAFGKVFHLLNPNPPIWNYLFNNIRSLGYPLKEIASDEWWGEIKSSVSKNPKDKLYAHLLLLRHSALFSKKPQFDAHNMLEGLAGTSIVCPSIDTKLLSTYFSYFQKSGYIPVPQTKSTTV